MVRSIEVLDVLLVMVTVARSRTEVWMRHEGTITTRPLTDAELAAQAWRTENPISNTRTLLFYYRLLPDRRLLFGARGDTNGTPAAGERMQAWMTRRLGEVFPAWREVEMRSCRCWESTRNRFRVACT